MGRFAPIVLAALLGACGTVYAPAVERGAPGVAPVNDATPAPLTVPSPAASANAAPGKDTAPKPTLPQDRLMGDPSPTPAPLGPAPALAQPPSNADRCNNAPADKGMPPLCPPQP